MIGIIDADAIVHNVCNSRKFKDLNPEYMFSDGQYEAALGKVCDKVDEYMDRLLDNISILQDSNFGNTFYRMFLSSSNGETRNFRFQIYDKYKHGRPPRPNWYEEVRSYLIHKYGAIEMFHMEADDAISIFAWMIGDLNEYVICTADKDLNQIPGWHYDLYYDRKIEDRVFFIQPFEANYLVWKQTLMGDSVDKIPGLKGVGEKKADKVLYPLLEEFGDEIPKEKYIQVVKNKYKEVYGDKTDKYRLEMRDQHRLVYILRDIREIIPFVTEEDFMYLEEQFKEIFNTYLQEIEN